MKPRSCRCLPRPLEFPDGCVKCGHHVNGTAPREQGLEGWIAPGRAPSIEDLRRELGALSRTVYDEGPEVTAPYVDGRALVAHLEEIGALTAACRDSRVERRVSDWRRGALAKVQTADELLVAAGAHLLDLPRGAFRKSTNGHGHRPSVSPDQLELENATPLAATGGAAKQPPTQETRNDSS